MGIHHSSDENSVRRSSGKTSFLQTDVAHSTQIDSVEDLLGRRDAAHREPCQITHRDCAKSRPRFHPVSTPQSALCCGARFCDNTGAAQQTRPLRGSAWLMCKARVFASFGALSGCVSGCYLGACEKLAQTACTENLRKETCTENLRKETCSDKLARRTCREKSSRRTCREKLAQRVAERNFVHADLAQGKIAQTNPAANWLIENLHRETRAEKLAQRKLAQNNLDRENSHRTTCTTKSAPRTCAEKLAQSSLRRESSIEQLGQKEKKAHLHLP